MENWDEMIGVRHTIGGGGGGGGMGGGWKNAVLVEWYASYRPTIPSLNGQIKVY